MSKAYIDYSNEKKRHEVHIKLLSSGLDAPVKLAVRTNADEGQLADNPLVMPLEYALDVGHVLTIVIED